MPLPKKIITVVIVILVAVAYIYLFDAGMGIYFQNYNTNYWVHTPGTYSKKNENGSHSFMINSLGLRGKEIKSPKSGTRILFLGDSMTLGGDVEEENTFVYKSQQLLQTRGYNVECINGGVTGYGPSNSLALYRHLSGIVIPDIVIMCLTTNDINDTGETFLVRTFRNRFQRSFPYNCLFQIMPKLSNHFFKSFLSGQMNMMGKIDSSESDVKNDEKNILSDEENLNQKTRDAKKLLKKKYNTNKESREILEKTLFPLKKSIDIDEESYNRWIENTAQFMLESGAGLGDIMPLVYGLMEPDYFLKSIDLKDDGVKWFTTMCDVLSDQRNIVVHRGGTFGIIYIPQDLMYEKMKQDFNNKFNYITRSEWLVEKTYVEKNLESFCKKENIQFLNLTPTCRELAEKRLTLKNDIHLNARGHDMIAALIADYLSDYFSRTLKKQFISSGSN